MILKFITKTEHKKVREKNIKNTFVRIEAKRHKTLLG
jgi:hypothetical protein